ncbi:unnamed protein product, partial [Adineta ricciae]
KYYDGPFLKYVDGSEYGITIIDGTPIDMSPSTSAIDIDRYSITIDKTGYIILVEVKQMTIWSFDRKFKDIAIDECYVNQSTITQKYIYAYKTILDKLGHLYVYVQPGFIAKFDGTFSTCKNNVV